jgi:hypothetical protein
LEKLQRLNAIYAAARRKHKMKCLSAKSNFTTQDRYVLLTAINEMPRPALACHLAALS